jgi:hypothetical protein
MIGVIRNPITRWQSEMAYSNVFKHLPDLEKLRTETVAKEGSLLPWFPNGPTADLDKGLRALRSWMNWEGDYAHCNVTGKYLGTIKQKCYYNNYLVRYLSPKRCGCDRGGCDLDLFNEVTEEDYLLARKQAANFHALLPLEVLGCDQTNAVHFLRSIGLNISKGYTFPHSHVTGREKHVSHNRGFYDMPEILKVFEDDNKWDLLLYDYIINELYPSYFCNSPLVSSYLDHINL